MGDDDEESRDEIMSADKTNVKNLIHELKSMGKHEEEAFFYFLRRRRSSLLSSVPDIQTSSSFVDVVCRITQLCDDASLSARFSPIPPQIVS